jgi:uncharacterized protein YydD (DUF2326 family)
MQFNEDFTLKDSVLENFKKHEIWKEEMLSMRRRNIQSEISGIQSQIGKLNGRLFELNEQLRG